MLALIFFLAKPETMLYATFGFPISRFYSSVSLIDPQSLVSQAKSSLDPNGLTFVPRIAKRSVTTTLRRSELSSAFSALSLTSSSPYPDRFNK